MERCAYCGKYHESWESYQRVSAFMSELYWCSKACTLNDPDFLRLQKEEREAEERAERAKHSAMNSEADKYREEVAKFSSMEEWYRFKLAEERKDRRLEFFIVPMVMVLSSVGATYFGHLYLHELFFFLLCIPTFVVFSLGMLLTFSTLSNKRIIIFRGEGLAVVEHFGKETFMKYKAEEKVDWLDHKGPLD